MSLNVLVSGKTQSVSCAHVQSVLRIKRTISAAWSSRHKFGLMDRLIKVSGSSMEICIKRCL